MDEDDEFLEIVAPVILWLRENHDPHVFVMIDSGGAELARGMASVVTEVELND